MSQYTGRLIGSAREGFDIKTWLHLTLVALTVGGGFTGVVINTRYLFDGGPHGLAYFGLVLVSMVLYTFVAAAGLLFSYDPQRTRLLQAALAIQIPWISTPIIVYKFAAGLYAFLTVGGPREPGRFGVYFGGEALLGSSYQFAWLQKNPWTVGVNFVALAFLVVLRRSRSSAMGTSDTPPEAVPGDSAHPESL